MTQVVWESPRGWLRQRLPTAWQQVSRSILPGSEPGRCWSGCVGLPACAARRTRPHSSPNYTSNTRNIMTRRGSISYVHSRWIFAQCHDHGPRFKMEVSQLLLHRFGPVSQWPNAVHTWNSENLNECLNFKRLLKTHPFRVAETVAQWWLFIVLSLSRSVLMAIFQVDLG